MRLKNKKEIAPNFMVKLTAKIKQRLVKIGYLKLRKSLVCSIIRSQIAKNHLTQNAAFFI